jgi:hypothetical protein
MFFCTGCMEICSWLHLQVVSQDIGTSNLFTTANPVPTKKRSQWLHRCSWKNRVGVVRTFGSYQSAKPKPRNSLLCCRSIYFPGFDWAVCWWTARNTSSPRGPCGTLRTFHGLRVEEIGRQYTKIFDVGILPQRSGNKIWCDHMSWSFSSANHLLFVI